MPSRLALLGSVCLALLLVVGCSNRERANPLDPRNPSTQGRPSGFVALAGNGSVVLSWQPEARPGVFGYQAFRRGPGESEFHAISDVLPVSRSQLPDFGVTNGSDYQYRLFYVLTEGPSGPPAEATATPGAIRPWVTDYGAAALLRLTPDGRHVLSSELGFLGPTQVAVDPASGLVWTSDTFANRVVVFNPLNGGREEIANVSRPFGVAVDPLGTTGWICDPGNNRLYHATGLGQPAQPALIPGVIDPLAVAVHPGDGSIWVCEGLQNRVRRFDAQGLELWEAPVSSPSRVAIDSVTRQSWVTSFSGARVIRIGAGGELLDTLGGFQGPIGIDVDPRRGRVWIADAVANQIVVTDRAGAVQFRLSSLSEVREIAVDRASGEAWATVPGAGMVVRISATGAVNRRLEGLVQPYAIAIDPGTR